MAIHIYVFRKVRIRLNKVLGLRNALEIITVACCMNVPILLD